MMFKFELGSKAKDLVSGWTGIVTAQARYLNGCVRYCLDTIDKDGKPTGYWFDEAQLKLVKANAIQVDRPSKAPGGPRSAPAGIRNPE
jgi:hypothetical protein